jgi:hypothetical protein
MASLIFRTVTHRHADWCYACQILVDRRRNVRAAWYERTGTAREVLVVGEMPDPVPGPAQRSMCMNTGIAAFPWTARV